MFDGHISHVNKAFLYQCLDYQVLPVCLPSHMIQFLQSLDILVFDPLKYAYLNLLQAQYAKGECGVWKGNFYKLLTVHKRRPLQAPIFLVDFVILDFSLWTLAL